ncbi:MAG: hypothetical protein KDA80_05630 [Planctomycetaceae bacterium]|nr:hypothetical protein [Planctomycetaceae bacterium]
MSNDVSVPNVPSVVTVGGVTKDQLRRELRQAGVSLNAMGQTLLADDRLTISESSYLVPIVVRTVRDLGFSEGATAAQIERCLSEFGFEACPAELAPFLRLQFLDQPKEPRLTVFSRLISPYDVFPNGFYLQNRKDGLWLRGYTASFDWVFPPDENLVFKLSERTSGVSRNG